MLVKYVSEATAVVTGGRGLLPGEHRARWKCAAHNDKNRAVFLMAPAR